LFVDLIWRQPTLYSCGKGDLIQSLPKPRPDVRVYIGTLVKDGDAYVLKAGNEKYLLDSQKKAKNYKGRDVKITGTLDKTKNVLHIEKIEVSPSL
jgi:hypothetical protein